MFIDPTQIIDSLDIEPGMKIADFGSGAGFYAIALAKKAGEGGKVYAVDIQKNLLEEARRILKPNGKVAVAEWEKNAPKIGPPAEHRLSSEETRNLFLENGFKLDKEVYAGEYHYGLVFRK